MSHSGSQFNQNCAEVHSPGRAASLSDLMGFLLHELLHMDGHLIKTPNEMIRKLLQTEDTVRMYVLGSILYEQVSNSCPSYPVLAVLGAQSHSWLRTICTPLHSLFASVSWCEEVRKMTKRCTEIWTYRKAWSLLIFSSSFSHNSPFPLALCMQTGTLIPLLHNCSEMLPFHRKDASHSHTLCKQDINCYTSEDMQHYAWKGYSAAVVMALPCAREQNPPFALFSSLFWGWQNSASSSLTGKKLCNEKHPPPLSQLLVQGCVDPYWPCSPAADLVPTGQFLETPAQITRTAWLSVWVSLSSCKPLSSPLPQSDAAVEVWTARRGEPRLRDGFDVCRDACSSSWRLRTAADRKLLASAADLQSNHRFFFFFPHLGFLSSQKPLHDDSEK